MIDETDWDEYAVAGFTYWPESGSPASDSAVSVAPRPDLGVEGPFPLSAPGAFVTAHNPGGPIIDTAENDRRHAALLADVAAHGWHWLPAVGGDPAGSHTEDGVLLLDASPEDARGLGLRFHQDAIYVWRADTFELIACDGSRHDRLGWTAQVGVTQLTRPAFD
ncbi:MAG: DUF3293 domain-containing protein [Acidimicrobiia bacterium]|nr:DUF3293 domain-containing protein [Acidimicrobiia bacterium]